MRYLSIFRAPERNTPPSPEHIAEMNALIEEMTKAGVLLSTEGCLPSALGMRIRRENGKTKVTDGPFTESKEVVGGFALLDFKSKAEAIRWTERFLALIGDGECEVRRLYEGTGDCGPGPEAQARSAAGKPAATH
jgi:hypothetical protein